MNARAGKIASGEIEDVTTDDSKNAAAVALGRMGGKVRAAGMSARRRKQIAKKAAKSTVERLASIIVHKNAKTYLLKTASTFMGS